MNKDLYLIRHGQSLANAGIADGFDVPLSPHGRVQAGRCGEFMAAQLDSRPIRMISSPFLRTVQTADLIASRCELRIHLEPALHELFLEGWFTPGNVPLLPMPDLAAAFPRVVGTYPDGAWWPEVPESKEDVARRAACLRNRLLGREFPEEVVICVSHAGFVAALAEALCPEIAMPDVGNASVTHLHWDGHHCHPILRQEQGFLK
ncbi:MAG: histidine phosphatase family protein [FCB group bacterium]|nr:histidine phosphatase family protein [FCB group bacterium]